MTTPPAPDNQGTSTRPYLIRALHDWCTDNGFTPYIAVYVDRSVQVPMEYVKNNEIVLNVGFEATSGLKLGNDLIEFKARFGGAAREIVVPVDHVVAIYARENGQGMAFPVPTGDTLPAAESPEARPELRSGPGGVTRGLRLASEPGEEGSLPSQAPSAPTSSKPGTDEPPTEPPAPGGGRPSLKRVK
jgi:stringent starvation protein B